MFENVPVGAVVALGLLSAFMLVSGASGMSTKNNLTSCAGSCTSYAEGVSLDNFPAIWSGSEIALGVGAAVLTGTIVFYKLKE